MFTNLVYNLPQWTYVTPFLRMMLNYHSMALTCPLMSSTTSIPCQLAPPPPPTPTPHPTPPRPGWPNQLPKPPYQQSDQYKPQAPRKDMMGQYIYPGSSIRCLIRPQMIHSTSRIRRQSGGLHKENFK